MFFVIVNLSFAIEPQKIFCESMRTSGFLNDVWLLGSVVMIWIFVVIFFSRILSFDFKKMVNSQYIRSYKKILLRGVKFLWKEDWLFKQRGLLDISPGISSLHICLIQGSFWGKIMKYFWISFRCKIVIMKMTIEGWAISFR